MEFVCRRKFCQMKCFVVFDWKTFTKQVLVGADIQTSHNARNHSIASIYLSQGNCKNVQKLYCCQIIISAKHRSNTFKRMSKKYQIFLFHTFHPTAPDIICYINNCHSFSLMYFTRNYINENFIEAYQLYLKCLFIKKSMKILL